MGAKGQKLRAGLQKEIRLKQQQPTKEQSEEQLRNGFNRSNKGRNYSNRSQMKNNRRANRCKKVDELPPTLKRNREEEEEIKVKNHTG